MKQNKLLVSIDFRSDKGGIARVANLIARSLNFSNIFSLHGKTVKSSTCRYYNGNRLLFSLAILKTIFFQRPSLIVFDHLNIARILLLLPSFCLKKTVVFLHDEEAWVKVTGLRKIALLKASHILCNSDYTKKEFLKNNPVFNLKTSTCLLGGVPEKFFEVKDIKESKYIEWFNDKRPYCLFISRLWKVHRYKGYFELLQAFNLYIKSNPKATLRLAIIGKGDDTEEVEAFIKEKNVSDHISLFQDVEDHELLLFYKQCQCFVFPSIREGFGMVFLEAMYFKKACIGIAGQPAEEIIVNNETGILLKNNAPDKLKNVLTDIESNRQRYIEMGEKGYQRFYQCFSEEHFKNRLLKAIDE